MDAIQLKESKKFYSMKELACFLGCTIPTAQKIKNSGKIPFYQIGRKCIFDSEKVLKALEQGNQCMNLNEKNG